MHEIWLMFELSNYNSSWFMSQLIQGKSWLDVNKCEKLPLNWGTPKRRSAWEIDGEPLFFLVTCDCRGFYYFCIGLFFGETFGKSKEKGWKKTILEKKKSIFSWGTCIFFIYPMPLFLVSDEKTNGSSLGSLFCQEIGKTRYIKHNQAFSLWRGPEH